MTLEYQELTAEDQLAAARGRLRGLETDHYNLTLTNEQPERRAQIETQHAEVLAMIRQLEKDIEKTKAKPKAAAAAS